jgi:hypothetical protein
MVLDIGATSSDVPRLVTYLDRGGASKLPYVCEVDIAIRIERLSTGSILAQGKAISYADSANRPGGGLVCANNFPSSSGNVACKQAGFDKGRVTGSDLTQQEAGRAPRVITGGGCFGDGTSLHVSEPRTT